MTYMVDQDKLSELGLTSQHWLELLSQYEDLLSAFRRADWSDRTAREKIASLLVQKTQQYLTSLDPQVWNQFGEEE